ncbi:MAG TPA: cyclic nucleotide-binding domain-containing protein, partial [Actinomycetota bacterium]|nr:cyclic nucleotide-binding domain-containing protein [Actinomycetota bacterium]
PPPPPPPPPPFVGFAAVALPDLRPDPEVGDGWARFGQTAGGLLSVGMPYRGDAGASRLAAPAAWTTLSLTIHADGRSTQALVGASPFPRHWVYDHDGRVVATSGVVDFTGWQADAWDPHTPWGGRDAPVRATAVETALERELSRIIVGSAPHWLRLRKGATLVSQGDPGDELFLLFDGLLAVEIDGRVVTELGPGAVVGEVAVLAGGRRTATLRAVTVCRVAAVPGDRIDRAALAELARTRGWPGPEPPDPPGDHPGGDDPA